MGGHVRFDPHKEWRATAVKALTESIAHWERLRDGTQTDGETCSSRHCACCQEWPDLFCDGCPIAIRTDDYGCAGSPYLEASNAFYKQRPDAQTAIQAEVDFLTETRHLVKLRKVSPAKTEPG